MGSSNEHLSLAGAQRVLSCRAVERMLSLRSIRATYLESEERRDGARNTRVSLFSGDASCTEPFLKEETF